MNGLWWDEVPLTKIKEKPYAFWLEPTYLPGLAEAKAFPVDLMTYEDMIAAKIAGDNLVCDTECYPNYWLCAFRSLSTGKVAYVEMIGDNPLDCKKLQWFIDNFTIVTFNGIHYDLPMIQLAASGLNTATLKWCSDEIIEGTSTRYQLYKRFKAKKLDFKHMDIKEVCPLDHSLKKYGSRIHTKKMQDLPFAPETKLSDDQIAIVRYYCCNDLAVTGELFDGLIDQIKLRVEMSKKYGVDLRSKSDAQIAEAVISHELMRLTGVKAEKPTIPVGTTFKYKAPEFIQFQTPYMRELLSRITSHDYVVNEKGSINLPDFLKGLKISLGTSSFTMGIGGLHSNEKKQVIKASYNGVLERKLATKERIDAGDRRIPDDDSADFARRYIAHLDAIV